MVHLSTHISCPRAPKNRAIEKTHIEAAAFGTPKREYTCQYKLIEFIE